MTTYFFFSFFFFLYLHLLHLCYLGPGLAFVSPQTQTCGKPSTIFKSSKCKEKKNYIYTTPRTARIAGGASVEGKGTHQDPFRLGTPVTFRPCFFFFLASYSHFSPYSSQENARLICPSIFRPKRNPLCVNPPLKVLIE